MIINMFCEFIVLAVRFKLLIFIVLFTAKKVGEGFKLLPDPLKVTVKFDSRVKLVGTFT